MGVGVQAPRGGLAEKLAGAPRVLILRNAEIERFEDLHQGIFDAWDGFMGRGPKPTSTQVRDLVALGLIGGGLEDAAADALVAGLGPDKLQSLYAIASALIGVAFTPELADETAEDDGAEDGEADPGKKT